MIPDIQVDRVTREGAEPGWVTGLETIQPQEDGLWHLQIGNWKFDTHGQGDIRACRMIDGAWTDTGPAILDEDASIHPDLKGGCATFVKVARSALSAIPRGSSISIELASTRSSAGGDEVIALTTFLAEGDISEGMPKNVPEEILDIVPGVRFLERTASGFATMFGVEPYDDGSGISGGFKLTISTDALFMSYEDHESGTKITVESELNDDRWSHYVFLDATEHASDGMDTLRRLKDPAFALESLFEDFDHDNSMVALLGLGLDNQVPILVLHREDESTGPIRFMLEPGHLR